jgi:hypothetical protein
MRHWYGRWPLSEHCNSSPPGSRVCRGCPGACWSCPETTSAPLCLGIGSCSRCCIARYLNRQCSHRGGGIIQPDAKFLSGCQDHSPWVMDDCFDCFIWNVERNDDCAASKPGPRAHRNCSRGLCFTPQAVNPSPPSPHTRSI